MMTASQVRSLASAIALLLDRTSRDDRLILPSDMAMCVSIELMGNIKFLILNAKCIPSLI